MRSLATVAFVLTLAMALAPAAAVSSSLGLFDVSASAATLAWSNSYTSNFVLTRSSAPVNIAIDGSHSGIHGLYAQKSLYTDQKYRSTGCLGATDDQDSPLTILNASGAQQSSFALNPSAAVTMAHTVSCPPGRYAGQLRIANQDNASDYAFVNVTVNVPIDQTNELDASSRAGSFRGTFDPMAGYHSFLFNTSAVQGSTGITIDLSWGSANNDLDLFLFDQSGTLKAKSVGRYSNSEHLSYSYLPANQVWEIRIAGNASETYSGTIKYSTLSVRSGSSQLASLEFGSWAVGEGSQINATLRNDGLSSLSNVHIASSELYRYYEFQGSSTGNFTFLVPSFAKRVRASLAWAGSANYSLTLYSPSGQVVGISDSKQLPAKAALATAEELVETEQVEEGSYTISIKQHSGSATFSAKGFAYLDTGGWLASSLSSVALNPAGQNDSASSVAVSASIPQAALNGQYKGTLALADATGAAIDLPASLSASTATLLVAGKLASASATLKDNIGFNRSGSQLQASILLANIGEKPIGSINCTSSMKLNNGNGFIGISFACPTLLGAGQSSSMPVNFAVDVANTGNRIGLYSGTIGVATTNSAPYKSMTLTLNVNLTDELTVEPVSISTQGSDTVISNASVAENVTVRFRVKYVNGNEITDLPGGSFSVQLFEPNANYTTANLALHNVTPLYSSSYGLVAAAPAGLAGGRYSARVSAAADRNSVSYKGVQLVPEITVNEVGILLASGGLALGNFDEKTEKVFNASVRNLGQKQASGLALAFNPASCPVAVIAGSYSCPASPSVTINGSSFIFDLSAFSADCWFSWRLTGNDVSATSSCSDAGVAASQQSYGPLAGISMTVNDVAPAATAAATATVSEGSGGVPACIRDDDCGSRFNCVGSVCVLLS
ncbi:MAG: hypothetical protein HY519_03185, partial [Candidatus Aenigmarchaeota archaeon]|nr:hypothetical protein [Candidatus Aenigmarchaeota archaeon]